MYYYATYLSVGNLNLAVYEYMAIVRNCIRQIKSSINIMQLTKL